jgi:hypothetical protein
MAEGLEENGALKLLVVYIITTGNQTTDSHFVFSNTSLGCTIKHQGHWNSFAPGLSLGGIGRLTLVAWTRERLPHDDGETLC